MIKPRPGQLGGQEASWSGPATSQAQSRPHAPVYRQTEMFPESIVCMPACMCMCGCVHMCLSSLRVCACVCVLVCVCLTFLYGSLCLEGLSTHSPCLPSVVARKFLLVLMLGSGVTLLPFFRVKDLHCVSYRSCGTSVIALFTLLPLSIYFPNKLVAPSCRDLV